MKIIYNLPTYRNLTSLHREVFVRRLRGVDPAWLEPLETGEFFKAAINVTTVFIPMPLLMISQLWKEKLGKSRIGDSWHAFASENIIIGAAMKTRLYGMMKATLPPIDNAIPSQRRAVVRIKRSVKDSTHNHPIDGDPYQYAVHRREDAEFQDVVGYPSIWRYWRYRTDSVSIVAFSLFSSCSSSFRFLQHRATNSKRTRDSKGRRGGYTLDI